MKLNVKSLMLVLGTGVVFSDLRTIVDHALKNSVVADLEIIE